MSIDNMLSYAARGGSMTTLFLISPARCGGPRAEQLARSPGELGVALRGGRAPIGDVMSWLSALYFRGKLTYARAFAAAPAHVLVMAPGAGLRTPDAALSATGLAAMGKIDVESEPIVRALRRDAQLADRLAGGAARVVLLGSIATGKYVDCLLEVFGARLVFPSAFVGRGDMSRGGLLLRAARSGDELAYAPIAGATLHGPRPPKLPRVNARASSRAAGTATPIRRAPARR